jgi:AAA15 family ATPase/GTPase
MLTKFTVGNFLSFKDKVTFSLLANSDKEHREAVFTVKNLKKENKFIKAAAIYGLNGSGKSNFIRAIKFFLDFVTDQKISATPFLLNTQTEKEPSFFEAEIIIDGEKYAYGFEILIGLTHQPSQPSDS